MSLGGREGGGQEGFFFCQTTKKNSKWRFILWMTTAFPFHQESYLPIISPCMNTGIRMWTIHSDELQNLWTARTLIVNCWHVNPPDSCWLCSEVQAISECGNLKKTFCIRHWPHTHTRKPLTHKRGAFARCEWNRVVFFYNADLFYLFSKLRFAPVASGAVAHFFFTNHPTQISRSPSLSAGSSLFFPFSTRAFPLPCRPRPWFSPVIPVNLMLKRSLRQSITAKTTKSSLPAGVSVARADRGEPTTGNAHSVSPSRVNRGRETDRTSPLTGRREPYC